ncbi:AIPR family protein [Herbaspirillum rubrisubalbicans]|uniref:AIPR family protein n=1 Tax=Herbaspirillum rubrisubalbicans TaxID=80842 RepID=UPI00192CB2E3|nr:AIPR family protein [Herbaspirillum rubrisubalbicans]
MFEEFLDLSDISQKDPEREQKILSRCLAAFCVYNQAGCTEQEAAESVWDGSDDNGIDAAFYDSSEKRVIFVQSKWINKGTGEPEAKDLGAFIKGVRDIIEEDDSGFHSRLHARFKDIALRIVTPGTSIQVAVVSTGASKLARHGNKLLDDFLHDMNGEDPNAIASKVILGLTQVYDGLANDLSQNNVAVDATILDWSFISRPYAAYFGLIDGLSLKTWWLKHGKSLLSSNIRHALGSTDVNNEIRNTAINSSEKFWYFNNGITLIANEAAKAPMGAASRSAGNFSFRGASIVNGAQTVSSLARVAEDEALGKVRVPIRVILLKDAPEGFGNEVTRTNNLQNRVEPRDFVAQDPEQRRLRQEMAMEGIDYQFVRTEDVSGTPTFCELMEVTTALACAQEDSSYAVQVKTGLSSRFFAELKKAPYKTLFNASISGARAFNTVLVLREVEAWIDGKKLVVSKRSGPKWGVLVHGNRILASAVYRQLGTSVLSQPIVDFRKQIYSLNIPAVCDDMYTKMVDGVEKYYQGKFLAVLFKNPSMSKHIYDLTNA